VLALVFWSVPWADQLRVGEERYPGTIVGDWKSEQIGFRFSPETSLAEHSLLKGTAIASAVAAGGEVTVEHEWIESEPVTDGSLTRSGERERISGSFSWRPGMPRAFRDLEAGGLLPALAFAGIASLFAATRWWRLLAIAGCPTSWTRALRLTYVGLFFNLVLPGLNGGDVARAVLAVRASAGRRADALMSVIVDRLIGLLAMVALALFVVFFGDARFAPLRWPVVLTFGALIAGLVLFLHPGLRRLLRFETILAGLPQGERLLKLDRALRESLRSPGEMVLAFALSLGNHLFVTAQIYAIARAFGDRLGFLADLGVVTLSNTVASLPTTPGGIGISEAAYGSLFALLGSAGSIGVATSITYRLTNAALSLLGGASLLLPAGRVERSELARAELELAEAEEPHRG
jgi:uncharacterized protein (TIRG00374 family)